MTTEEKEEEDKIEMNESNNNEHYEHKHEHEQEHEQEQEHDVDNVVDADVVVGMVELSLHPPHADGIHPPCHYRNG